MEKILVFGTGSTSQYIVSKLDFDKVELLAFINTDARIEQFYGYKVIGVNEIKLYDFDYVLVASGYVEKIRGILLKEGIDEKKLVAFIFDDAETYLMMKNKIDLVLDDMFNRKKVYDWIKEDESVSSFYPAVFWDDKRELKNYYKDFTREQTVKLLSDRIHKFNISGCVAELGVFRGDFTIIIQSLFPDRKLYLYDSFEGFSATDLEKDESIENRTGETQKFKETSVEFVLNRLSSTNELVVRKGFFPDTFLEDKDGFCFVSIDFNLYDPVKSALDLFYPQMINGGYILVSDYYAPFYSGTRKAVDLFCKENNKTPIPVSDFYGSVIIAKD